ncbi:Alpha-L-fucosidase [Pirellulimonas nuda]|uniref:alpha-L-fucosidase n=1 Tax=Pirellulimonas nuda TaxID=2528009 RepID=A0A518DAT9_9BACT|nr:alpha-L-fucosidase [Pirellulimonas nuda]QDU88536.1 Alpha-L-fucosidase [Pirellulimonas nuda]
MTARMLIVPAIAGLALAACSISLAADGQTQAPAPFLPVPGDAQLKWHKAEYRMFIHFGMKTFYPSSNHKGDGKEDPARFNPERFDANQWVAAAKAGGFEGIVLTTKHHDGFCNWPTQTTEHSVRASPWKNGQGDIVGELVEACRRGGITFGFYVSLIDDNYAVTHADRYAGYGDFYYDQVKEISTQYGPIDEYWFDGFKADELKIDYQKLAGMIKEEQPGAVVYDSGTMVRYLPDRSLAWPGNHGGLKPDQSYRREMGGEVIWYPNEPSLMLQGNWFHNGQPIKDLEQIKQYYLTTTGYGVTPLMNLSPNQDGLIDEASVEGLKAFKDWVDALHANDLSRGDKAQVSADSVRGDDPAYAAAMVADGDFETYHATDDAVQTASIEVDLGGVQEVDGFIIQEYIPLGQRIESYSIECLVDGRWKKVFAGKTIGYKRIILEDYASAEGVSFPPTSKVRLNIESALACPLISTFQVVGAVQD